MQTKQRRTFENIPNVREHKREQDLAILLPCQGKRLLQNISRAIFKITPIINITCN